MPVGNRALHSNEYAMNALVPTTIKSLRRSSATSRSTHDFRLTVGDVRQPQRPVLSRAVANRGVGLGNALLELRLAPRELGQLGVGLFGPGAHRGARG